MFIGWFLTNKCTPEKLIFIKTGKSYVNFKFNLFNNSILKSDEKNIFFFKPRNKQNPFSHSIYNMYTIEKKIEVPAQNCEKKEF